MFGRCCVYVREDLKAEIIESSTLEEKVWILSTKLFNCGVDYNVTVLYFSPNASKKTCIEYFDGWCNEHVIETSRQVVCGDFNVNLLKYGTYQTKIKNVMECHGLKQFVRQATRVTEHSKSKIDLVMSNLNVEANVLTTDIISDHSTLEIKIEGLVHEKEPQKIVKKLVDYKPEILRQTLNEYEWESILSDNLDLNERTNILSERISAAIQIFVKEVKVNRRNCNKWFDQELKDMRMKKEHLHTVAALEMTHQHWMRYRMERNKYHATIRDKKRRYIENKLHKANGDTKETWKILKSLLNGKRNGEISEIQINGKSICDSAEIAEKMNEYYVSSIVDINRSIVNDDVTENGLAATTAVFDFTPVHDQYLKLCLMEMKNKKDIEFISPGILLDAWPIIATSVCRIVNQSLEESMPDDLKTTIVAPVPKVNRPKKPEDYRPINMLPTLEKLIETVVVKNQIIAYIEDNNLLSVFQSGYRTQHSCETALNFVLAKWKEMRENGDDIVAVFLDLKRAFETIDRKRLLAKLSSFGFTPRVIKWFEGYLKERSQQTKVM